MVQADISPCDTLLHARDSLHAGMSLSPSSVQPQPPQHPEGLAHFIFSSRSSEVQISCLHLAQALPAGLGGGGERWPRGLARGWVSPPGRSGRRRKSRRNNKHLEKGGRSNGRIRP